MTKPTEKETFLALLDTLQLPRELVSHWEQYDRNKIDELTRTTRLLLSMEFPLQLLPDAMTHWKTQDWRGKQGTMPTPTQFGEIAAVWWRGWQQTQETLNKGQRSPRWRGGFDSLAAKRAALEEARAERTVKPDEWKQLARLFTKADRHAAAAACDHKTQPGACLELS